MSSEIWGSSDEYEHTHSAYQIIGKKSSVGAAFNYYCRGYPVKLQPVAPSWPILPGKYWPKRPVDSTIHPEDFKKEFEVVIGKEVFFAENVKPFRNFNDPYKDTTGVIFTKNNGDKFIVPYLTGEQAQSFVNFDKNKEHTASCCTI